jgi:hypothetical protein
MHTFKSLLSVDRLGSLFGGEVSQRALEQSVRVVSEIEDLCPRWPFWPKGWPPPPLPWTDERMPVTALFLLGTRFLAAADVLEQGQLQETVARLRTRRWTSACKADEASAQLIPALRNGL